MLGRPGRHLRRWTGAALAVFFVAAACCFCASSVPARSWKPTPSALAQDYSIILDNRGKQSDGSSELVIVFWLAPPMVPPEAQSALDKYILIGIAHAHLAVGGSLTFDKVDGLQANGGDGKPLTLLGANEMPPTIARMTDGATALIGQSLGAFGHGVQWFVFDGGSVRACGKGRLSVPFAGETYTYDTPIPGCPKA